MTDDIDDAVETASWSPFGHLEMLSDEDDFDKTNSNGEVDHKLRRSPTRMMRNWGIPTFQDQMDRGIKTFQLKLYEDDDDHEEVGDVSERIGNSNSDSPFLILHLEHRLHSTGSDLWDAALVLIHALPRLLPTVLFESTWRLLQQHPIQTSCTQNINNNIHHNYDAATMKSFPNLTIIELGSGTGAVGLFCFKRLGVKHVILTDQHENLPLIRKNCFVNQLEMYSPEEGNNETKEKEGNGKSSNDYLTSKSVTICELDWRNPILPIPVLRFLDIDHEDGGDFLLVGSDLFLPFASDLLIPLVERIAQILSMRCQQQIKTVSRNNNNNNQPKNNSSPVAILAYEERFDCSIFFKHAALLHLNVEKIQSTWLHPKYQDLERIHLLRITK